MNTVQEKWLSFESECVPKHIDPKTKETIRLVFYAGVSCGVQLSNTVHQMTNKNAKKAVLQEINKELFGVWRKA